MHSKIKIASRMRNSENFCSYIMPEVLIGYPNYNLSDCLVFIIDRLQKDGFLTRYIHPNLLFISWNHWIPGYVREEYKKKTGISIDCYGEPINKDKNKNMVTFNDTKESKIMNNLKLQNKFVYDDELFSSIKDKL